MTRQDRDVLVASGLAGAALGAMALVGYLLGSTRTHYRLRRAS